MHPDFYEGPAMVKPPIVYLACLMRASGTFIHAEQWIWLSQLAGQQLFYPPNVSGWDDSRWLDTATYRARWAIASHAIRPKVLDSDKAKLPNDALKLMHRAEGFWGNPALTGHTHAQLMRFVKNALRDADDHWKKRAYPAMIENALRQLLAASPDLQTS